MKEIWKDIVDYEGYYQVSNLGKVKSLKRFRIGNGNSMTIVPEKYLKHKVDRYGYTVFGLTKNAKTKMFTCHRLVAKSFLQNTNNYEQVNHINGIKSDNSVSNLEWCDHKHNMREAFRIGLCKSKKSKDNILSKRVAKIKDGEIVSVYDSITDACNHNNVVKTAITNCLRGRSKTSCGYGWTYL